MFSSTAFAQTEVISKIKKYTREYSIVVGNEKIILNDTYKNCNLTRINLLSGETTIFDSVPYNPSPNLVIMDSTDCFYIKDRFASNGNDLIYSAVFLDYLGISTQKDIGSSIVKNVFKHNGKFYFASKSVGTYYLWESNGTTQGTQVVYQTSDEIKQLYHFENKLFFMTKSATMVELFQYTTTANLIFSTPHAQSYVSLNFDGERNNGKGFFHFYRGPGNYQFWETDYTLSGTTLFLDSIDAIRLEIEDTDSTFLLFDNSPYEHYWRGLFSNPLQQTLINYKLDTDSIYTQILGGPTKEYRQHNSYEHGLEWARAPKNDSIFVIQDLAPGINRSILAGQNNIGIPKMTFVENDTLFYTMMTNSNDEFDYLYEVNGNDYQCLFRIDELEKCSKLFKHNGSFYWYVDRDDSLDLMRHIPSATDILQPTSANPIQSEKWYREVAFSEFTYFNENYFNPNFNNGIQTDSDGNSISSFTLRYNSKARNSFYTNANEVFLNNNGADVLVKHDKYGKIMWLATFGGFSTLAYNNPQFKIDSNNDIYVAGSIFQNGRFGNDSVSINRCGVYLIKIDGTSGDVLWHRIIGQSFYISDFEIEKMILDEENNIYLAAAFTDFHLELDGQTISSKTSPANALAKYDSNGQIIWLKSINTPWSDKYGATRILDYNEVTNEISAVQSQGYYNWSSSCEYSDWRYNYQVINNENGDISFEKSFSGTDLGSLPAGILNKYGDLVHFGFFRGSLDFQDYLGQSPPLDNCHQTISFASIFSPETNEHISLSTSDNFPFFPLDVAKNSEYIYAYGTDEDNRLNIIRFDHELNEKGYLPLYQKSHPYDFGDDQHLAVTDSFILVMGNNFVNESIFTVHSFLPPMKRKSYLKFDNSGWQTDKIWFNSKAITPFGNIYTELTIYPNPFKDQINIIYTEDEKGYTHYIISDLTGKIIQEGALTGLQKESISTTDLSTGMYTITLFSTENKVSKQLLRY